ncbi:MAG: hypothetical protein K1X94_10355 [Sandaracinaceae bacterium]|nr:hypothetical protein [Sandaracinaceae bacterium]
MRDRRLVQLVAAALWLVLTSGCFGLGFDQPERISLRPYPLSLELPAGFTQRSGSGGAMVLEAPEDARVVTVSGAAPGGAASTRTAAEILPGASLELDWARPATLDGMSAVEMRVRERSPEARTHWIAVIDAASGVVFLDVAIDDAVTTSPSGDVLWDHTRDSIRSEP